VPHSASSGRQGRDTGVTSCGPRRPTVSTRTLESLADAKGNRPDTGLHELSHGEGFLDLLQRKFFGDGFFLMDEPEAPLSFTSTLALAATLHDLRTHGAQIVVATHSPLLTALPDATILELGDHGIRRSEWADLDLVRHWRSYLERPAGYLGRLLSEPVDGSPAAP
jgi:predicted ATPase